MATQVDLKRTDLEPDFAALVAIDWGNNKHVWSAQSVATGVRERGELEARPEIVDTWITAYLARFPGRPIAVALDKNGVGCFTP